MWGCGGDSLYNSIFVSSTSNCALVPRLNVWVVNQSQLSKTDICTHSSNPLRVFGSSSWTSRPCLIHVPRKSLGSNRSLRMDSCDPTAGLSFKHCMWTDNMSSHFIQTTIGQSWVDTTLWLKCQPAKEFKQIQTLLMKSNTEKRTERLCWWAKFRQIYGSSPSVFRKVGVRFGSISVFNVFSFSFTWIINLTLRKKAKAQRFNLLWRQAEHWTAKNNSREQMFPFWGCQEIPGGWSLWPSRLHLHREWRTGGRRKQDSRRKKGSKWFWEIHFLLYSPIQDGVLSTPKHTLRPCLNSHPNY